MGKHSGRYRLDSPMEDPIEQHKWDNFVVVLSEKNLGELYELIKAFTSYEEYIVNTPLPSSFQFRLQDLGTGSSLHIKKLEDKKYNLAP